jgi:hypothetical protein
MNQPGTLADLDSGCAAPSSGGRGLRAFGSIAEAWGCTLAEQLTVVRASRPAPPTSSGVANASRALPQDTLERLSYLLGIYKSLQILLPDPRAADAWVRKPNSAAVRRTLGTRAHAFRPGSPTCTSCASTSTPSAVTRRRRQQPGMARNHPPCERCGSRRAIASSPSRLPTIHLFERVADPADWDALYQLESHDQSALRNEAGDLNLVPVADRVSGLNATVVMAPFTHIAPQGTRFTDGHFGAYYAAESLDTAIAETRFHRENFLRATTQPALELEMRCYLADVACELHDYPQPAPRVRRHLRSDELHGSQKLGRELRDRGFQWRGVRERAPRRRPVRGGIPDHDSCRTSAGRPPEIRWDGNSISNVYEIRLMNL